MQELIPFQIEEVTKFRIEQNITLLKLLILLKTKSGQSRNKSSSSCFQQINPPQAGILWSAQKKLNYLKNPPIKKNLKCDAI